MGLQAPQVSFVGRRHHRLDHDHTYASCSGKQRYEISLIDNIVEAEMFLPFPGSKHWVCQAYRQ